MFSDLKAKYNLVDFIETGYGEGAGVKSALEAGFESVTSIEIVSEVAEAAGSEWAEDENGRVTILENNSYDGLSLACQKLRGPILFYLDAYLPAQWGYTKPADEFNYPLEVELEVISACRPVGEDVILINNLSLYERGCEKPVLGWKHSPYQDSDFIERLFEETHTILRDKSGVGTVTLTPKTMEEKTIPAFEKKTDEPVKSIAPIWDDETIYAAESSDEKAIDQINISLKNAGTGQEKAS